MIGSGYSIEITKENTTDFGKDLNLQYNSRE